MFLENKYRYFYYSIINKALSRKTSTGYVEKHHIVPRSLGGDDTDENLVSLTAREHFVCHWLLTKMVEDKDTYKMFNALNMMMFVENKWHERYKVNSRTFERLKIQISEQKSIKFSGEGNAMYGKKHTKEAKLKMSKAHTGRVKSKEEIEKLSKAHKGKPKSEAHKQALKGAWAKSDGKSRKKNTIHSEETKQRIREGVKNMPLEECYKCGFKTTKGNIRRWHNDNCKKKVEVEIFQG